MIAFVSQLPKLSFRGRRFHMDSFGALFQTRQITAFNFFIINTFLGSFVPTEREE